MRSLAALAVFALVSVACGSAAETIAEQAAEQSGGGDVDVEFDSDGDAISYDVETEDGSASVDVGSGDLVEGFPVPVPDGGDVLFSGSSDMGGTVGYSATISYPAGDYERLVDFYTEQFADLSDTQTFSTSGDASTTTFSSAEAGWSVSIVSSSGGVQLAITTGA
ncbi:MAG: hypothetical protein R3246_04980 [Acidimicrobiia bacterium]|nr:hypothetical protein [Acidimicrobiia bacterium]